MGGAGILLQDHFAMADSNPESNAATINVPIELLTGQSKSDAGSLLDYKRVYLNPSPNY